MKAELTYTDQIESQRISISDASDRSDAEGDRDGRVRLWGWLGAGVASALLARVVYFTVSYGAAWLLAKTRGPMHRSFLELWTQWDTQHFVGIAQHGYFSPSSGENWAAFFPFYPLTIRPLLELGFPRAAAGLLVSAIASVVAFGYLYRLVAEEFDARTGVNAVSYMIAFPTSVFLIAAYSEALFLAGAIAAFYYARRGQWLMAVLPGAIATGTRAAGIFVVLGLGIEFLRQRDFTMERVLNAITCLALSLLPVTGFLAFLTRSTGSANRFFEAQRAGWGRGLTSPVNSLMMTIHNVRPETATNWRLIFRLEVVAAFLGILLVVWACRHREWGYAAFMGSTLALMLSSSWYYSIPRILITFFPAAILLARTTRYRPTLHTLALSTLAPFAAVGVIVFTKGQWFF